MIPASAGSASTSTLRLVWPQWQGAGPDVVRALFPEVPLDEAHRGYAVGTTVLEAVLPAHDGPSAVVPVTLGSEGLETRDGVDAKDAVVSQLRGALGVIAEHDTHKIVTIGGECSVSVAPFSVLANRYGDDLAVIWIDSHPDVGTPESEYHGYHAMALATLCGHGDDDVQALLPATVPASRVALAGLHSWTEDDFPNAEKWGISTFSPEDLRSTSDELLEWLASTGCSRVAVHLDVDVVDSDEALLGLGIEPGGLTSAQVRRLITDIDAAAEVVGFTIAEYIPRQVMALQRLVDGLPLL
ncbi:arginase family protein [Streptomyces sp. NPDC050535]|uniref:arginase family protein n=1 Tax=Streptomyces sp. NPDC050535 TaxID=3365626 RepID=UPI00379A331E